MGLLRGSARSVATAKTLTTVLSESTWSPLGVHLDNSKPATAADPNAAGGDCLGAEGQRETTSASERYR